MSFEELCTQDFQVMMAQHPETFKRRERLPSRVSLFWMTRIKRQVFFQVGSQWWSCKRSLLV